jgi:omega-amidase
MRTALVSLNISWNNKELNKSSCHEVISKIAKHNVKLIIFPEMTLTGFNMNPVETGEDSSRSRTIDFFRQEAIKSKVAIVFGVVLKQGSEYFNCAIFVDDKGELISKYAKIHLFSHSHENLHFQSGDLPTVASFFNTKIGLTICYDLRFPEIYSFLAQESDLILNIANWPSSRDDHWETLLRARAIENQTLIIGVNRVGIDAGGQTFTGLSKVIYPDGICATPVVSENEFSIYNIDFERTRKSIESFSTISDRRSDLYKQWA